MINAFVLDLDGTVYLGEEEVPGAARFISRMRALGKRCLFLTNRANRTPGEIVAHLGQYGIACDPREVLTSAQGAAEFLAPGRFYCIGEAALVEALEQAGHIPDPLAPDYVVVGFDRGFNYRKLTQACRLIHKGARFIATNPDRCLLFHNGLYPGTGAMVAAIEAGCGCAAEVIGKPERRLVDIAVRHLGVPAGETVMVGDSLETDIPAGAAAGLPTALLLTGVSRREHLATARVQPTWVAESYAELESLLPL